MPLRITQWDDLKRPIHELPFVGARYAARLARLGITTVRQLLWHLPSRHEDYTAHTPIAEMAFGERVTVQGCIERITTRRIFPRRLMVTTAVIRDDTGTVNATWFNRPYIEQSLPPGTQVSLAGKVTRAKTGLTLSSPQFERLGNVRFSGLRHTQGLIPVYPETEGVSSKYLRMLIQPLVTTLMLPDPLPSAIREQHGLISLTEALRSAHYPKTRSDTDRARTRLAFDELLLFQLKALLARRAAIRQKSVSVPFDQAYIRSWVATLPFTLTKDQRIAAWEIIRDLAKPYPMNRLLEGDVGSGKTAVALLAALQTTQCGHQVVFMAPTEVLAAQHYQTARSLVHDVSTALITSSRAELDGVRMEKRSLKARIARGSVRLVIGTHAVIQKSVRFADLALVIVDEQHRFGIRQRSALLRGTGTVPHLLSMTATPIPRTLALTIFGDLDISLLREKPADRQPIVTQVVSGADREVSYAFIRSEVRAGRQAFVICPRVELATAEPDTATRLRPLSQRRMDTLWAEVKAVRDEYKRLTEKVFPDLHIAMLHGRMKPQEKERIMRDFRSGAFDVLVATSVIEVGIDVPNATLMIIENAERFGLAQLHQFRGRIGRGEHRSYCFLFASADTERLQALMQSSDGFELAEKDLMLRGPGEFFGIKQSGMPDLAMAALADVVLIKKARLQARLLLKNDPTLARTPLLKDRLGEFKKLTHFE